MHNTNGAKLSSLYHSTSSAGSINVLHDRESRKSVRLSWVPMCSHISRHSSEHCNTRLVAVVRDIAKRENSRHALQRVSAQCNLVSEMYLGVNSSLRLLVGGIYLM